MALAAGTSAASFSAGAADDESAAEAPFPLNINFVFLHVRMIRLKGFF